MVIYGCDFEDAQDGNYVSFGGTQAVDYERWTDSEVVVKVPEGVTGELLVTIHTAEGISQSGSLHQVRGFDHRLRVSRPRFPAHHSFERYPGGRRVHARGAGAAGEG
ncbi:MAG: IPT/TIG domain-containing protein [Actinomycetota bacterium]